MASLFHPRSGSCIFWKKNPPDLFLYAKLHFALDVGWYSGVCCRTRDIFGLVSPRGKAHNCFLCTQHYDYEATKDVVLTNRIGLTV